MLGHQSLTMESPFLVPSHQPQDWSPHRVFRVRALFVTSLSFPWAQVPLPTHPHSWLPSPRKCPQQQEITAILTFHLSLLEVFLFSSVL